MLDRALSILFASCSSNYVRCTFGDQFNSAPLRHTAEWLLRVKTHRHQTEHH